MGKTIKVRNVTIGQGRPKICAVITGQTEEEILRLAQQANDEACDLVEFRADYYEDICDEGAAKALCRKLRRTLRKPLIFTFRRECEGGMRCLDAAGYRQMLTMVADGSLAEIIDVEASALEGDPQLVKDLKGLDAYVILSLHDFEKTPSKEEILKNFMTMQSLGADIIKVAYMPNSKRDVLNLVNAAEEMTSNYSGCPVVAISMGPLGMVTRLLGEFLESAITFASITKASAPGQINVGLMENILNVIHDNYRKIFLIGFMATGKTTVANALSNNYGLNRIDLDAYIESKENASISDIFSRGSEELFRDKETKYLRRLVQQNYQVISLGGGAVLRKENVDLIKEKGIIVLLTATPQTIAERTKGDYSRPLLAENMDLDYIRELMHRREAAYLSVADIVISTDGRSVDDICREIVAKLGFNV